MYQTRLIFNPKYQPHEHGYAEKGDKTCSICGDKKDEHHEQFMTNPTYTGFGCAFCGCGMSEHFSTEKT